jgi:hypothetical protein
MFYSASIVSLHVVVCYKVEKMYTIGIRKSHLEIMIAIEIVWFYVNL